MDNIICDYLNQTGIKCIAFKEQQSVGIPLTPYPVNITFDTKTDDDGDKNWHTPLAIIYGSDDGEYVPAGVEVTNNYFEYSLTRSDAFGIKSEVVDYTYENHMDPDWESWEAWLDINRKGTQCRITAVRDERYVLVRIENAGVVIKATTTVPEEMKNRDLFLTITGEKCQMTNFKIIRELDPIESGAITPVTYRKSDMEEKVGDIPNVNCSGWWTAHSDGILIDETPVRILYDTISYINASENWNTPIIVLYSAFDQTVEGIGYKEFAVTRSDAYGWITGADAYNFEGVFSDDWTDWPDWLAKNKAGVRDCEIMAVRREDSIIITQTNAGVTVKTVTQIPLDNKFPVYLSLTGELCALSNIRIERMGWEK